MAGNNPVISITTLRGGLNDNDPPILLTDDACPLAENVEFFYSTIGERRLGCEPITISDSIKLDTNLDAVTWMGIHYPVPTGDVHAAIGFLGESELWVLAQSLTHSNHLLMSVTSAGWTPKGFTDEPDTTNGYGHRFSAVSLHGKFFIAYNSGVDRLHVSDGGYNVRRAGQVAPSAAPTGANTGGGAFSGTRYYRVRYVVMSGSSVLRRSEPSDVLTFTPSGAGTGVVVTKSAATTEGETHWELEASQDNANFYRIARTDVGTATATDSTSYAAGYASVGPLSEDLTSYTTIPAGKFVTVDQDRLIIAGSWLTPAYASRVWWTPPLANTGAGNDERLDMTINPYIDLDGFEGGEITAASRAFNGYLYVFKWGHIYKIVRTGNRENAYNAVPLTKSRGALPGSLIEAVDQTGSPSLYFLDPKVGPMRIGSNGMEWCAKDLVNTWGRVNLEAKVPCHGVFYQAKNQIHYWLALDGSDYPNAKIVLQIGEVQSGNYGARRGWSTVPVGDRIAAAHCSIMFSENLDSFDQRSQVFVPFIGKEQWLVGATPIRDLIQKCDTGSTDAYTSGDTDAYYYASIQTKPFRPTGLLTKHGVQAGTLVAASVDSPPNDVYIEASRNFGEEVLQVATNLSPSKTESIVVKRLDQLNLSDIQTIQFKFGDLNPNILPTMSWKLHEFSAKLRVEQSQ